MEKKWTEERLEARYKEAANHRLVKQAGTAGRRHFIRWINPFHNFAALCGKITRCDAEPALRSGKVGY